MVNILFEEKLHLKLKLSSPQSEQNSLIFPDTQKIPDFPENNFSLTFPDAGNPVSWQGKWNTIFFSHTTLCPDLYQTKMVKIVHFHYLNHAFLMHFFDRLAFRLLKHVGRELITKHRIIKFHMMRMVFDLFLIFFLE